MNKALLAIVAVLLTSTSVLSQSSTDGTIIMKNAGVLTTSGTAYNVPLYQFGHLGDATAGAGLLPGGVTVGLFTQNGTTPLATGLLGTAPNNAAFIFTPLQQTVTVTGSPPGSTPTFVIRAWQTAFGAGLAGYNAARNIGGAWGEWSFTTQPLGGTPPGGGLPITSPTFTGWGEPNGTGYTLPPLIPEPSTIALGVFGLAILALRLRQRRFARAI
jgi:hypothetical protein